MEERRISKYDADKRNIRYIKSFCYHLRTYKNIGFAGCKCRKNIPMRGFPDSGIRIHSQAADFRKELNQLFLDLLRADACILYVFLSAVGAFFRHGIACTAVVAAKSIIMLMICERNITIRTVKHEAARSAFGMGRISAPVEKQNGLF